MTQNKLKLSDLYVVGKEWTVSSPQGDVKVWLQKMNPAEADEAFKKAQAARARVLAARNDTDSDVYQSTWLQVLEMSADDSKAGLVDFIALPERLRIEPVREAEAAAEPEWADDGYLDGLRQAWDDGLEAAWITDPEDPEAKRVYGELKRFSELVDQRVQVDVDRKRREVEAMSLEDLRKATHDVLLDAAGNGAWLDAYHKATIYFGTRQADVHTVKYFDRYAEVQELMGEVQGQLHTGFESMKVDVIEGKGSEEAPTSSAPSEPQAVVATVASSGLATVGR